MANTNHSDVLHLADLVTNPNTLTTRSKNTIPPPGSKAEIRYFQNLQNKLGMQYRSIFMDPGKPRTVVVIPSLSMDATGLAKIKGAHHYEERLLCMLMLLRLPRTNLIYLSSEPIAPCIIDYYLHLLPGIPEIHARKRLTLLACHDSSPIPLTQKVLERPRLIQRVLDSTRLLPASHITCFNATHLERSLSVRLGMPLYACDPSLNHLGSKSGSRELFKTAGVPVAPGMENLNSETEIVDALVDLKQQNPELRRAVVKLNEGFSGEGNAVFSFNGAPENRTGRASGLRTWVKTRLPQKLKFEATDEKWDRYLCSFEEMGGIVEEFIEGAVKRSPSVQCRINPLGEAAIISTHDQVLGGPSGQIFLGCTFPADGAYRLDLQHEAMKINNEMVQHGVLGRYGIDFISVKEEDAWRHYAVEVNLRKGGTTHPYLMLQFLTDGHYEEETGLYRIPTGQHRYYYASDNLVSKAYEGLTPEDLIDISVNNGLHFHGAAVEGVVFHLIGALSEFGKLGILCVGASHERAHALYKQTVQVMNQSGNRLSSN